MFHRTQCCVVTCFQAARSLCRAAHIAPSEPEFMNEDIPWVLSLKRQKESMHSHLDDSPVHKAAPASNTDQVVLEEVHQCDNEVPTSSPEQHIEDAVDPMKCATLKALPKDYVYMRS